MPKVTINSGTIEYGGLTEYKELCLHSESDNSYAQDRWCFYLNRFAVVCCADRQIIQVDGYLPQHNWNRVDSISVPETLINHNFVIDEPFDPSGRDANETVALSVDYSVSQRIVRINDERIKDENADCVFVSPHEDLLVGAIKADTMRLSSFLLLNVRGIAAA